MMRERIACTMRTGTLRCSMHSVFQVLDLVVCAMFCVYPLMLSVFPKAKSLPLVFRINTSTLVSVKLEMNRDAFYFYKITR